MAQPKIVTFHLCHHGDIDMIALDDQGRLWARRERTPFIHIWKKVQGPQIHDNETTVNDIITNGTLSSRHAERVAASVLTEIDRHFSEGLHAYSKEAIAKIFETLTKTIADTR
jgi:hypothetical protein